jgi:CRISPR type III-B/RAMP module-associated protein Cmr5
MRLDQELARKAAELLGDTVKPDLRTRMRSLPVMIQTSGLAATVAFLLSRAKGDDRDNPYWQTAELILSDAAATAGIPIMSGTPKSSLKTVAAASAAQYVLAETRAIQLAIWLSRLADALVERSDSPEDA